MNKLSTIMFINLILLQSAPKPLFSVHEKNHKNNTIKLKGQLNKINKEINDVGLKLTSFESGTEKFEKTAAIYRKAVKKQKSTQKKFDNSKLTEVRQAEKELNVEESRYNKNLSILKKSKEKNALESIIKWNQQIFNNTEKRYLKALSKFQLASEKLNKTQPQIMSGNIPLF